MFTSWNEFTQCLNIELFDEATLILGWYLELNQNEGARTQCQLNRSGKLLLVKQHMTCNSIHVHIFDIDKNKHLNAKKPIFICTQMEFTDNLVQIKEKLLIHCQTPSIGFLQGPIQTIHPIITKMMTLNIYLTGYETFS